MTGLDKSLRADNRDRKGEKKPEAKPTRKHKQQAAAQRILLAERSFTGSSADFPPQAERNVTK